MNKLFKMLQESFGSAPQRNGFDLSRRDIFSTKVGMKVPAFCLETVPNDYHEIRPVNLIRTLPFNEANFVRLKQHLDFYYVPFTAFQTNFHEVLQQTTDPVNSLLVGDSVRTNIVNFDFVTLFVSMVHAYLVEIGEDTHYHDYGITYNMMGFDLDNLPSWLPPVNDWSVRLFLKIGYPESETRAAMDVFGNPVFFGTIRLLDMLGYGNFLPVFDSAPYGPDEEPWRKICSTILDSIKGKKINIFRLAAYQCVYQNFGLNTIYDKLDVYSFNFDDVLLSPLGWQVRLDTGNDPCAKIRTVFTLRYSQWKKDIFTAAYPDSQFGGVSVVSVNYKVGDVGTSSSGVRYTLGVGDGGLAATGSSGTYTRDVLSSFNILDLRRAEALQGWKEDMMRSGFRAKQRQKSQFGVSPSYDPHCMPYSLGSIHGDIQKDPVQGTSGEQFAELAAIGRSSLNEQVIKFDGSGRNDFGIIIGLLSIIPDADYDSFGLDLHNTKLEPFDFYTPAFQNIGLQALPSFTLSLVDDGTHVGEQRPLIHGYVPRYSEYKQAVDKVHGEFCSYVFYPHEGTHVYHNGEFRHYVSSRLDMERYGLTNLGSLYINPNIVDDIFKVDADSHQSTDQFFVNCYFDVKSVRPMSVLGLPRF